MNGNVAKGNWNPVWQGGQVLLPSPFGLGRINCRVEAWRPGLVLKFRDGLPPAVLAWASLEELQLEGTDAAASDRSALLTDLLLRVSHPLRFSPYHNPDWGRFLGREAELALLHSPLPSIILVGQEGVGKSALLLQAAKQAGSGVIQAQAMTALELEGELHRLLRQGRMPQALFLDEMDTLLLDPRAQRILARLNHRGIAWRAAVHRTYPRLGPNIRLGAPRGLERLLEPLARISLSPLSPQVRQILLTAGEGNPRALIRLCRLTVERMGESHREISSELAFLVCRQAEVFNARTASQGVV